VCWTTVIHIPPTLSRNVKMFLINCFQYDPTMRLTASEALQHPWLKSIVMTKYNNIHYNNNNFSCQVNFDLSTSALLSATPTSTNIDVESIQLNEKERTKTTTATTTTKKLVYEAISVTRN
jgi:serine/threonine protein kinase